jgi:hypothetical protein
MSIRKMQRSSTMRMENSSGKLKVVVMRVKTRSKITKMMKRANKILIKKETLIKAVAVMMRSSIINQWEIEEV